MIKQAINTLLLFGMRGRVGDYIHRLLIDSAMQKTKRVVFGEQNIYFSTPSVLAAYRANSFADKEPETLKWIASFKKGGVFWDVGANVGIYSCYAAKLNGARVFCFEPSVFNLELLARNINLNTLQDLISIIPIALANTNSLSAMNMSSTEWGGALSSFSSSYGQDGKELNVAFFYKTAGMRMDDLSEFYNLEPPNYLKIDVDGTEHLILEGGIKILNQVESVLIEVNHNFIEQKEKCDKILSASGLSLIRSDPADLTGGDIGEGSYNEIWNRV